jgi:4-amino-4-deoxy-L-arabinose transferase-like glycosyltransferase
MNLPVLHNKNVRPVTFVVIAFLIAAAGINPLRETAAFDDWAYGLTVKHLVDTGQYQLHNWLAANMPFQAYWGMLFSRLFGYSFVTLRLSTLALSLIGLISFYLLAHEHDLEPAQASFLALILLASPLYLQLSYTFMTDIPFLAMSILALLLYTRAFRLHSYPVILAASLAAAAAILTRQFGAAFLPGIGLLWLFGRNHWQHRRSLRAIPFYIVGLLLPLVAMLWQVYAGSSTANWTANWLAQEQMDHLVNPLILFDVVWRLMVILQYMALFTLPLVLITGWHFVRESRQVSSGSPAARLDFKLLTGFTVFILITSLIGSFIFKQPGIMPLIPWNLAEIGMWPAAVRGVLTMLTMAGAFLYGRIFVLRYLRTSQREILPVQQQVLDAVSLFLLIEQLVFLQFGDEYLLPLLPFTLIVVGRRVLPRLEPSALRTLTGFSVAMLLISVFWVRDGLAKKEAQWSASDALIAEGAAASEIITLWEWEAYHGSFDRYFAGLSDPADGSVGDYLETWKLAQLDKARYLVLTNEEFVRDRPEWVEYRRVAYRDGFSRTQHVIIYQQTR